MSEEQVQAETAQVEDAGSTDVDARIEAAIAESTAKIEERYKKEISGLNRRNSELEKVMDDQKKAAMTKEEQLKYDLEKERSEITTLQANFAKEQNRAKATAKALELGVPVEMLEPLNMESWDSVSEQIDKFKTVVDGLSSKFADEYAKSNGDKVKRSAFDAGKSAKDYTADEVSSLYRTDPDKARAILAEIKQKG